VLEAVWDWKCAKGIGDESTKLGRQSGGEIRWKAVDRLLRAMQHPFSTARSPSKVDDSREWQGHGVFEWEMESRVADTEDVAGYDDSGSSIATGAWIFECWR